MVELELFISQALASIVRGIQRGRKLTDVGAYVAPLIQGEKRQEGGIFHIKGGEAQATIVEFDVLVATNSSREGKGGGEVKANIYVAGLQLGTGGKMTNETSQTNRLHFKVPLQIPT